MAGPPAAGGSVLGGPGVGADRGEGAGAIARADRRRVAWQGARGGLFKLEGDVYAVHD